jgi:hypothetical protein
MLFFSLVAPYLFRNRFRAGLKAIDDFLYWRDIRVRYSYRQYILLQDPEKPHSTRAMSSKQTSPRFQWKRLERTVGQALPVRPAPVITTPPLRTEIPRGKILVTCHG